MGKGGQKGSQPTAMCASANQTTVDAKWVSPYKPLDKDAPPLPTKGQIEAVIPKECFKRSSAWSLFYLLRDLAMAGAFLYASSLVLTTKVPTVETHQDMITMALWVFGWAFYGFWMGTIMFGHWILAHECGHGAFFNSELLNDVVGFVLHQFLLVPYFPWQYSHAKHHKRVNHLTDGESHIPFLPPRDHKVKAINDALGDTLFIMLQITGRILVGWQLYLLGYVSTGKYAYDGTPLKGRLPDHFRWTSPMFPPKFAFKVFLSTVAEFSLLGALGYCQYQYGTLPVFLWYWNPYLVVYFWLITYTWLHHTDPSVPHYGEDDWTWMKGALSTIDRDYGIFCFFHHKIGSTHVVHHLFHELPWYHADKATAAVKAYLEPKGLYNFDPTPWWKALWKVGKTCHFVDTRKGTQYYRSVIDLPSNGDFKVKCK